MYLLKHRVLLHLRVQHFSAVMIMNGRAVGGVNGGGCRFPFTASQWKELEHQTLIFKHMASGVPIPPDLLFPIRRGLDSKLLAHPAVGWNCFEMGLGRRIVDPEPGRCRRTDGKKWRCSKEAFQDSKYCERHMHRGKNRSRKPVEQVISNNISTTPAHMLVKPTQPTIATPLLNTIITTCSNSRHSSSVTSDNHLYAPDSAYYNNHPYHLHSSSNSRVDSTHLGLHSASCCRSRYNNSSNHGPVLKEVVDEQHSLLNNNEVCGTMKGSSMGDLWHLTPLTISSSGSGNSKQTGLYPYLQHDSSKMGHQMEKFYESSTCEQMTDDQQTQKTVYRFLEEWPPVKKDYSWLNLDDKSSSNCSSSSTTQLSISIVPATSHHVFPIFKSRPQNDDSHHSLL